MYSGVIILPVQDGRRESEHVRGGDAGQPGRLAALAGAGAERLAIEAEFPGWTVRVLEHDGFWRWEAEEEATGAIVWADDAPGLRSALTGFGA
jgi:hypothetical protein